MRADLERARVLKYILLLLMMMTDGSAIYIRYYTVIRWQVGVFIYNRSKNKVGTKKRYRGRRINFKNNIGAKQNENLLKQQMVPQFSGKFKVKD